MLLADELITIYHKTYNPQTRLDDWTPHHYVGSWFEKRAASPGSNGLNPADTLIVRIPADNVQGEIVARPGDVIIRGKVSIPITSPSQIDPYKRFAIMAVRDNRRGAPALRHWKIEGA